MRRLPLLRRIIYAALALAWATVLLAQSSFVVITPEKVTLLVGESKTFRLVDQNGRIQRGASWSLSDIDAFDVDQADELTVTAKRTGEFRIDALSSIGSAEASVSVMEGTELPQGAVKWSGASIPGCKTTQVVPAVPSASGADVFEQTLCPDGAYVAAYTSEGIQLWRHKIGSSDAPVAEVGGPAAVGAPKGNVMAVGRLNTRSTSVCDLVLIGTDQRKVRDLLDQRKLSFNETNTPERVWVVDETGAQCSLWFDDKSVLSKKRKTFVSE